MTALHSLVQAIHAVEANGLLTVLLRAEIVFSLLESGPSFLNQA